MRVIYEYEPVVKVNRKRTLTVIRQLLLDDDGKLFERTIAGCTFNPASPNKFRSAKAG